MEGNITHHTHTHTHITLYMHSHTDALIHSQNKFCHTHINTHTHTDPLLTPSLAASSQALADIIYLLVSVSVCKGVSLCVFTTCIQLSLCRLQRHLLQDKILPTASPYVSSFQLSVSQCVTTPVTCHVKIMYRCSCYSLISSVLLLLL